MHSQPLPGATSRSTQGHTYSRTPWHVQGFADRKSKGRMAVMMNAAHVHNTLASCHCTTHADDARQACPTCVQHNTYHEARAALHQQVTICACTSNCLHVYGACIHAAATRMLSLLACICRQRRGSSANTTRCHQPHCCPSGLNSDSLEAVPASCAAVP
jgi:hypothetical protein